MLYTYKKATAEITIDLRMTGSTLSLMEAEQNSNVLHTIQCLRETWSTGDAGDMLSEGGILLGVPKFDNNDEMPFHYTIGFPFPENKLPARLKEYSGRR